MSPIQQGLDVTDWLRNQAGGAVHQVGKIRVEAIPVAAIGHAVDKPAPRVRHTRQDLATDLASRLQLGADEVRVFLSGKEKGREIGLLLEKVKFEESEQVEGATETPTDCNQYSMCPLPELCNIRVSVAPRRRKRAPRWQGGKVTLQDSIPQRSDRAKIAAFLNTSTKIASRMWAHCRE